MNDFFDRTKEVANKAKGLIKTAMRSVKDFADKTATTLKRRMVRQKPVRKYSGNRRRKQTANPAQVVYRPSAQRAVMKKSSSIQRDVVAVAKQKLAAVKEKMNYKRAAVALVIAFMCIVTPVVAVIATNNGQEDKFLPEAQAVALAETQEPSESPSESKDAKSSENTSKASKQTEDESGDVEASVVVEQQSDAEPTPTATEEKKVEEKKKEVVLQEGVDAPEVAKLQERLMELDYMENDEPTEHFGPITAYAVQLFQRKHDLQIDGIAGGETLKLIYAEDAKRYTVSEGVSGTDVEELQKRLAELGYLESGATGYFGTDTSKAVEAFQKRNHLDVDGNVGAATREALYSEDAIQAPEPEPEPSESPKTDKKDNSSSSKKDANKKDNSSSSKKDANKKDNSSSSKKDKNKKDNSNSSKKDTSKKKEKSTTKVPNNKSVSSLIKVAKQQLGKKYVRGGKGPDVFDCSGFVYYCLNQAGYEIGYMTSAGWASSSYAKVTSLSDMKKGDILCFKGHVGIYLGGNQMIDASSSQGKIRITGNLGKSSYWKRNFICGRRVLVK